MEPSVGKTASQVVPTDENYKYVLKVASWVNADAIIIENVPNMIKKLASNGKTIVMNLMCALKRKGFMGNEYRVLNASDFEVPQTRKRVFVLGWKEKDVKFEWPEPVAGFDGRFVNVMQDDLSVTNAITKYNYDVYMSPEKMTYYLDRKMKQPTFVHFIDPERTPRTLRAGYMKSRGAEALIMKSQDGTTVLATCPEHPPATMRMYTIDECKAIQTFPPEYEFHGSTSSIYQQIGNAVPVRLAYHIGTQLRKLVSRPHTTTV